MSQSRSIRRKQQKQTVTNPGANGVGAKNGKPTVLELLHRQVALLTKGHNDLVEAYNARTKTFMESFQQLDLRVGAMQLVLDDMVQSSVTTIEKDGKKVVHWEAYQLYYQKLLSESLMALKGASSEEKLITPEVPEASEDVVFGGDQGTKDGKTVDQAVGA